MTTPFPDGLQNILPPAALPPPGRHASYAVDGLSPMAVAVPQDRPQAQAAMQWAAQNRVTIFPRGGGTKLALGNPPDRVGLVLDLSRLNRIIDYQPGDLTATVEAGITLADLQRQLAAARQFAPIESPLPERATIGGSLAAASAGPMAHAYGPPRDWLIGIAVINADGAPTKAGGRVVKNVTGYDLNKLYTGSLGTLAVIVEASLKVSPLPPDQCMLAAPFPSMTAAVTAGRALLNLPAGPASYLALTGGLARRIIAAASLDALDAPGEASLSWMIGESSSALGLCFFAGRPAALRRRVDETSAALQDAGAVGVTHAPAAPSAAARQWAADIGWQPHSPPSLSLKLSAPRRVIPALADHCLRIGLMESPSEVMADPGFGAIRLFFWNDADDAAILETVAETRQTARQYGASAIVESCHPSAKAQMDVWGDAPDGLELMRNIKHRLDPHRLLNPGRFLARI